MRLYFVTVNAFKAKEVEDYLKAEKIELKIMPLNIQEILHKDLEVIVKDKILKAYSDLGAPCVVEHGGLQIDQLNELPGGLSKVVWDTVGEQICKFIPSEGSRSATAKSVIGYCDGKQIHLFTGETKGVISDNAKGEYKFQWDPIFIPDGSIQTFAEMGFPEKAKYSQAAKAWKKFIDHIKKHPID